MPGSGEAVSLLQRPDDLLPIGFPELSKAMARSLGIVGPITSWPSCDLPSEA